MISLFSIVAVIAGTVLPYLAERDRRLLAPETGDDDEDEDGMETEQEREFRRIKAMVEGWKLEAKLDPKGKPVRLPTMPFMLRNIWTAALVLFSVLMCVIYLGKETPSACRSPPRHLLRLGSLLSSSPKFGRRAYSSPSSVSAGRLHPGCPSRCSWRCVHLEAIELRSFCSTNSVPSLCTHSTLKRCKRWLSSQPRRTHKPT